MTDILNTGLRKSHACETEILEELEALPSSKAHVNPALTSNAVKQVAGFLLLNLAATTAIAAITGDMLIATAFFLYFMLISLICLIGISSPNRWILLVCYITILILVSLYYYYSDDLVASYLILFVLLCINVILLLLGLFVSCLLVLLALASIALIWVLM